MNEDVSQCTCIMHGLPVHFHRFKCGIYPWNQPEKIVMRKDSPQGEAVRASSLDQQVGGDHYRKLGDYQPWKVLHATMSPDEFRGYMIGTAQAYLIRNKDNRRQDIEKAMHTLQGWLELTEGEQ